MNEELIKSIDQELDSLFAEETPEAEESVEKSIDIAKDASTKADEVVNKAPKGEDDEKRGAGRPKQISDVPSTDMDGKREGEYDGSISSKQKEEDSPEADQVKEKNQVKKSLTEEEYAEYMALKKAKEEAAQAEILKKNREEQMDLIKSAVREATNDLRKENEELRKSLTEQSQLVKAMAERPVRRKSIDNVAALEKSQSEGGEKKPESFSKSEMLDAAEKLLAKGVSGFKLDHVIELENTGFIYDANARALLEKEVTGKN